MEQKTTVRNEQSLFDIAIQEVGSIAGVFELAAKNNLSITAELEVGSKISTSINPANRDVLNYYKSNYMFPATDRTDGYTGYEGIDYWAIEVDFIVS